MRVFKFLLVAITGIFFLVACQKEFSMELGLAEGTLKEDGTGNCLPSTVNGRFKEDSVLNLTNYIDVQVNISEAGTYIIKSDTINGYSFYGSGTLDAMGLNTIRLYATGKPVDPGINTFTIAFDTSLCLIDVPVIAVGPPAVYALGGSGSNCTGVSQNGTYTVSVPMTPSNTVILDVNVTTPGSYEFNTTNVNGLFFSAFGEFTSAGPQTVTLNANGTPAAAGNFNYALTGNNGNTCTFPITVGGPAGPAVYTLGGAGSACTGFTPAGTYTQNSQLNASNTVTLDVNVVSTGTYSISTTAANNVTFTKLGSFITTGPQTVTLIGSGIPTAAGAINHTVNGLSGATCTFSITYGAAAPPATFTCTGAAAAGTYATNTTLTAANTATLQVNVTVPGSYSITTGAVNGMTFSGSGNFAAAGNTTVVLTGSGTPTAAGTFNFTPTPGTGCGFSVTVTGTVPPPTNFISCTIAGVAKTFNFNAGASYFSQFDDLEMTGDVSATSSESIYLDVIELSGGNVATGPYNNTLADLLAGKEMFADYTDASGEVWSPVDPISGTPDPFTITIVTLTATRVTGTFSGTLRNVNSTGTQTKAVTNGQFALDIN